MARSLPDISWNQIENQLSEYMESQAKKVMSVSGLNSDQVSKQMSDHVRLGLEKKFVGTKFSELITEEVAKECLRLIDESFDALLRNPVVTS